MRDDYIFVYEGECLRKVKVREREDGSGDVIFQRVRVTFREGGTSVDEIGFFNLPDVRAVKRLIDSLPM